MSIEAIGPRLACRRLLGAASAGVLALGVWAGVDAAEATSNLSVTATVTANCMISTAAVAFGSYDPVSANSAAPLDATGALNVTCTNGASAAVTLGQGSNADAGSTDDAPLRRMGDGGTGFLSYSLYSDASHTVPWGNTTATDVEITGTGSASAVTVYGRIDAGQTVTPGSYSDTVVATVTF